MAINRDCRACRQGNHEQHRVQDQLHTATTRLIGGTYCGCTGDCGERLEQSLRRISASGLFVTTGAIRGY